jgi:preprotein translocase subunit SecA
MTITGSDIDLQIEKDIPRWSWAYGHETPRRGRKGRYRETLCEYSLIYSKTCHNTGQRFRRNKKWSIYILWREKLTEVQKLFGERNFDQFQREIYLAAIDQLWMEHIEKMANLREDVAFEGI